MKKKSEEGIEKLRGTNVGNLLKEMDVRLTHAIQDYAIEAAKAELAGKYRKAAILLRRGIVESERQLDEEAQAKSKGSTKERRKKEHGSS